MSTPKDDLSRFFEYVWGDNDGYVYLPTKSETGEWSRVMYQWPDHKTHVVDHVIKATASNKDVYYAPALFREAKPPVKENVKGAQVLWVDFDGNAPTDWPTLESGSDPTGDTSETGSQASEAGSTAQHPVPSLRIRSSEERNQHVYWKLDSFTEDINLLEEKNRALAYSLRADTSGWDATQVLRPPHTTNYKNGKSVVVEEESNNVYGIDRFAYLKAAKQLVNDAISIDATVPVEDILAKYSWDTDTYDLFSKSKSDMTMDRSAALMRLGYYGAEKGMTDEEIFSILIDADDRWEKFKKRDDRKRRLVDIINKARNKYPNPVAAMTFAGLLGNAAGQVQVDRRVSYGFLDLLNADMRVEWLVDGLLAKGGVGLIAARGGVGKTQIAIQLALHGALGKNFIGYSPTGRFKTVIFELEMAGPPFKYFIETMAPGYSQEEHEILQRNVVSIPIGERIPLYRDEGRTFFESYIEEVKPDLVVIDSLGKVVKSLNDDDEVRAFYGYLAQLRNKFGCSFFIIHHNRKGTDNNKKPREQDDVYGSQYVTSEPDTVLTLWRNTTGGPIEVREVKNRLHAERTPFEVIRGEHLSFNVSREELDGDNPMGLDAAILSQEDKPDDNGTTYDL